MCGIAGILGTDKVNTGIETILNRISHRGPDGLFYWQQQHIAFGHARLKIIDLSDKANQPMIDDVTGNVIIFNGEIYNYLELKQTLANHYTFKTDSDTEVILAAYCYYGIDFLQHLRGMFAFALFDKQQDKILLARDRFGIKPLYYRNINGALVFASEIKAILKIDDQVEEVNHLKAYEFLADSKMDCDEQTLYKDIIQILPAHYMWVTADGKTVVSKNYWSFPELGKRTFDHIAGQELIDIFDNTIQLHLRSDVPVGSFLSGGLDSSSITCFALRNMQQPQLHAVSAVLPYFHPENSLIADVVNSNDRIVSHTFSLNGDKFFDDIPRVIYHNDEPLKDGSMYAHYKLCQLAKANNIKVLLSGSGGDELFGGYSSHIYAQHAKLFSQFRLRKYLKDIKGVSKNSSLSFTHLLFHSLYECLPVAVRRKIKNMKLKKNLDYLSIHPDIKHFYFEHPDPYYANLLNNYKSWTAPPFLHYEDRNSMAFGTEIRVPFFDHKLIEFIMQFNTDDIISGSSKSLMRTSFKGIVPDAVLQQKGKYGFPSPIDHALKNDKKGREIFFDLYKQTPLLKSAETEKLANDFYNGTGNMIAYWRTLSYIIWYQVYFTRSKKFI